MNELLKDALRFASDRGGPLRDILFNLVAEALNDRGDREQSDQPDDVRHEGEGC